MSISEERKAQLDEFQKKYNLDFKNIDLLNQAFLHISYVRENNLDVSDSYEKLEFYGDAVLKLVVSDFLYNHYSSSNEGELTNIRAEVVSDRNIFRYARMLGFANLVLLDKNERKHGGANKESILACAFEALLGAIFIDYGECGYKKAKEFLHDNFIEDILSEKNFAAVNPKALLQEYTQEISKTLPCYKTVREEGLAHNKTFFVNVMFENKIIGEGSASSLKKAQQNAAYQALKRLKIIDGDKK